MRWLCISDIHGDADALAAVLATAERFGYARVLAAGDHCFPGIDALDAWRRLLGVGAVCAQGVGDRALATIDPDGVHPRDEHERTRLRRLIEVRTSLGEPILAKLKALSPAVRLPIPMKTGPLQGSELLLVHGSPVDPTEPFTHDMSDNEMRALIGDDPADVIICGGSHVPFDRTVMGTRIINVGSVGEAMHLGGPRHAEATLLEFASDGELLVQPIAVPLLSQAVEAEEKLRGTPL